MTCDPATTISAQDLTDLKSDITTIDVVVESNLLTTTTKDAKVIDTLAGRLLKLGFQAPVTYAGSIVFLAGDNTKTIERLGIIYAPLPSALPFTTSGTWVADDEDKFFVIQGVILYSGDVLINKDSVATMIADTNLLPGLDVFTTSYLDGWEASLRGPVGGAFYSIVTKAEHDIVRGTSTVDELKDHTLANGNVALIRAENPQASQYGTETDGVTINTVKIQAVLDDTKDDSAVLTDGVHAIDADLTMQAGQHLKGMGAGGSGLGNTDGQILKSVSGTYTDGMIVMSAHTEVSGLKMNGNSDATTAIKAGPSSNGFAQTIRNIRFDGFTDDVIDAATPDTLIIDNVEFNGGAATKGFIKTLDGSLIHLKDSRFVPSANTAYAVNFVGTTNVGVTTVVNNLFESSNGGVDVSDFTDSVIIDDDHVGLFGNQFQANGASTEHLSHIRIKSGARFAWLAHNNFQNRGAAAKDIIVEAGALGTSIASGTFGYSTGSGVGNISDAGSGTMVDGYSIGEDFQYKAVNVWALVGITGGVPFKFDTTDGRLYFDNSADRFIDGTDTDDITISAGATEQIRFVTAQRFVCDMPIRNWRITTTVRDALTPNQGDVIFNTTVNKHQGYDGTVWNDFY